MCMLYACCVHDAYACMLYTNARVSYTSRQGVSFKKKPSDGNMRNLAFAYDPDMYWVELN